MLNCQQSIELIFDIEFITILPDESWVYDTELHTETLSQSKPKAEISPITSFYFYLSVFPTTPSWW